MGDGRYHALDKLLNLEDGYRRCFHIDAVHLLLIQAAGERYLIEAHCPHKGYKLIDGDVFDGSIACPLHHYRFDLSRGNLIAPENHPIRDLKRYEAAYRGNEIGVYLPDPGDSGA